MSSRIYDSYAYILCAIVEIFKSAIDKPCPSSFLMCDDRELIGARYAEGHRDQADPLPTDTGEAGAIGFRGKAEGRKCLAIAQFINACR